MMLSYSQVREAFDNFITDCRQKIATIPLKQADLDYAPILKMELEHFEKVPADSSLEYIVRSYRQQLINIKLHHTLRIVDDVTSMAINMNLPESFVELVRVAALMHDAGRFLQAVFHNSFSENAYQDVPNIHNHCDAGYHYLIEEGHIQDFSIPEVFHYAIGEVVKHHGDPILPDSLSNKVENISDLDLTKIDLDKIHDNKNNLIVCILVQMVKDVDMLDILYQHITEEFPVVRAGISYGDKDYPLEIVADFWKVPIQTILDFNGNPNIDTIVKYQVPVSAISLDQLIVPEDIQFKFFHKEFMDLQTLLKRIDYTFIVGMWWRLSHFLGNIYFVATLKVVEDNKLLDRIYKKFPMEYRYLVEPAFLFSKEELICHTIEVNQGNIYIDRKKEC